MFLTLDQIADTAEEKAYALGNPRLIPMIRRELLHYDLLAALFTAPVKDLLTFQGGTALRLCYGSPRLSEDLDFCAGDKYEILPNLNLNEKLKQALIELYGTRVSLKTPPHFGEPVNAGAVGVSKWFAKYDIFPDRPDLRKERVKIGIASVPAHSTVLLPVKCNYDDLPDYDFALTMRVESLEEILADKLLSFAMSPYIRWRDVWDMGYILEQGARCEKSLRMFLAKADDYSVSLPVLAEGIDRILQRLSGLSESDEYAGAMHALLPPAVLDQTVVDKRVRDSLADTLCNVYGRAKCLVSHY